MGIHLSLAGLYALAVLSPILTLLRLWQLKEWRIDRLVEHLKAEGTLRTLWGTLRPVVGAVLLASSVVVADALRPMDTNPLARVVTPIIVALCGLGIFATFSVLQLILRKQRIPVWTAKTLLLFLLTYIGNAALLLLLPTDISLFAYPVIVLAQPLFVLCAWVLLWPLDTLLKRRIMHRAERLRSSFNDLTVIAVCGSVGKTTTKELLRNALHSLFPLVTPAYVNTELGVAQWFLREAKAGHVRAGGTLVVEMGGYRTGEVALLCAVLQPTIGIVTSVGTQHIALFGSHQNILESEAEMPRSLPQTGLLLLNGDNPECKALARHARCTVITAGIDAANDLRATRAEETEDGLCIEADDRTIRTPLHGMHNVTNVLLAYAAAKAVGLDSDDVSRALGNALALTHTFHVSHTGGITLLTDTHNASPQSMAAGIAWASARPERPRVLCTTGIIEQGDDEARVMEEMGQQSQGVFDIVVFAGQRGKAAFERGYGNATTPIATATRVKGGGMLAAIGRIPEPFIERLLP